MASNGCRSTQTYARARRKVLGSLSLLENFRVWWWCFSPWDGVQVQPVVASVLCLLLRTYRAHSQWSVDPLPRVIGGRSVEREVAEPGEVRYLAGWLWLGRGHRGRPPSPRDCAWLGMDFGDCLAESVGAITTRWGGRVLRRARCILRCVELSILMLT